MAFLNISASSARAGLIVVGSHSLLPNTPNQLINIFAGPSGPGEIAPGLNFNVILGDGGSVVGGSDVNSPVITGINLKPVGGLFAGLTSAQADVFVSPKLLQSTIVALNLAERPAIAGNTLLAQLKIDTTGFNAGSWTLDLDGDNVIGLPSSDYAGLSTVVTNGSISITAVPEPSSTIVFLTALATGTCSWRLRRASKRGLAKK